MTQEEEFEFRARAEQEQEFEFRSRFEAEQQPKKTSMWEDIKISGAGALSSLDKGLSLANEAVLGAIGLQGTPEDIDRRQRTTQQLEQARQQWANPNQAQQSIGGKVLGTVATLPMQIAAAPGAGPERMMNMINAGESVEDSRTAGLIDTALNVAAMRMPAAFGSTMPQKIVTGGAANMGTGFASDVATQAVAKQEETKKMYDPFNVENRVVEGIIGMGFGAMAPNTPVKNRPTNDVKTISKGLDSIDQANKQQELTQGEGTVYVGKDGYASKELPRKIEESPEQVDLIRTETQNRLQEEATRKAEPVDLFAEEKARAYEQAAQKAEVDGDVETAKKYREEAARLREAAAEYTQQNQQGQLDLRTELNQPESVDPNAAMQKGPETLASNTTPPERLQPWEDFLKYISDLSTKATESGKPFSILDAIRMQRKVRTELFEDAKTVDVDVKSMADANGNVDFPTLLRRLVEDPEAQTVRADLAGLIKDLAPFLKGLSVKYEDVGTIESTNNAGKTVKAAALYNLLDHQVRISQAGANLRIIAHELVHAATVRAIVASLTPSGKVLKTASKAVLDLNRIYEYVKTKAEFIRGEYYLDGGIVYGLGDLREFASEVMTNRYLQVILERMPPISKVAKADQTLFGSFKEAVGRLFKSKNPEVSNLLKDSISLIGDTIQFQKNNAPLIEKAISTTYANSKPLRSVANLLGEKPDPNSYAPNVKIVDEHTAKNEALKSVPGMSDMSYIPKDPIVTPELKAEILGEKDGGKVWGFTPGGLARAELAKSTLVKTVYRLADNATKRYELAKRKLIEPAERAYSPVLRNPDKAAIAHDIMVRELRNGKRYSVKELMDAGVKEDIIEAHIALRETLDHVMERQNNVLRAKGEKPVTAMEAYMASRWSGPWRATVRDAEGNIVWQVAERNRWAAKRAVDFIKERQPDLKFEDVQYREGFEKGGPTDMGYLDMLKLLDKDDPRVQAIQSVYKEYLERTTQDIANQEKHFLKKTGVRGYQGDRAWSKSDAKDTFLSQFEYAKNALKWAEAQPAVEKINQLLNDKEIQEAQPNNVAFSKEHAKVNFGFGTAKVFDTMEHAVVKGLGIDKRMLQTVMGEAKSVFYLTQLANIPFVFAQLIQPAITAPAWHASLDSAGYKHNPAVTTLNSFRNGLGAAIYHYGSQQGPAGKMMMKKVEDTMSPLELEAAKYLEANSLVDINPMSDIERTVGNQYARAAKWPFEAMIQHPEIIARSMAFMGFVDHLRQSGKFDLSSQTDRTRLFQMAEDNTKLSMTDYRRQQRAPVFERMGMLGDVASTLHTYLINNLMQMWKFSKQAVDGNPKPLLVMMTMQGLAGGMAGLWGVDDIDDLLNQIKKVAPHDVYMEIKDWSIKKMLLEYPIAAYGLLSAATGTNINTRLSASNVLPETPLTGQDMGKTLGNAAPFIGTAVDQVSGLATQLSPSAGPSEKAEALYKAAPAAAKGPLEVFDPRFKQGDMSLNPNNLDQGMIRRSGKEETLRTLGFRSVREQQQKDRQWEFNKAEKVLRDRQMKVSERFKDFVGTDTVKASESLQQYVELGGDPAALIKSVPQHRINRALTQLEKAQLEAKSYPGVMRLKRALEYYGNETNR